MARGFRRRGRGSSLRYAARLEPAERALLVGLMEQVHDLLDAPAPQPQARPGGDAFDEIVAGLGGLEMGVSLSPEDQSPWPESGAVPPTARSFGDSDPALNRLLPAGNRADDQVSAEFRRLTEGGLRRRKSANLEAAMAALRRDGDAVELDETTAVAMVVALTDVRLVLGERLGLREDDDVVRLEAATLSMDPDDPVAYAVAVYDFLTWLQETLAHALLPSGRRH